MARVLTLEINKAIITLISACLLIGLFFGFLIGKESHHNLFANGEIRAGMKEGDFTNPLLECEIGRESIASPKDDFTPELTEFVDLQKKQHGLGALSVYYRDLNNGPVINVNANESFIPASLLKVPVLIAFLKYAEDVPGVLDEKVTYTSPVDIGYVQEFPPAVPLKSGQAYRFRDLIENMTIYSDNQALMLLVSRLPKSYQEDLYGRVGVDDDFIWNPNSALTVRQYSIFFRVLFNSSFLSQHNSEYALKLLSESTFKDGLVAGVPGNITVSHKFGEREVQGLQQFHDCGIIYYPKHPYLLCVMTRGADNQTLIGVIKRTSAFVYAKIDEQYGQE